jgi:hypothetical protein
VIAVRRRIKTDSEIPAAAMQSAWRQTLDSRPIHRDAGHGLQPRMDENPGKTLDGQNGQHHEDG